MASVLFKRLMNRDGLFRRLIAVLVISILAGGIGELYGALFYSNETDADYYQGFRTGFTIGFISSVIEIFYIWSVRRSWIRRVAFLPGLIVRILVLTVIVRVGLVGNELMTQYLAGSPLVLDLNFAEQVRDTLLGMAIVIVFVTLFQLGSIIGFKRFLNLVLGRYFRPVSEDRIFLFVDLVGSSELARKLGDVRFHEYLSEFFYQLDAAIVRTGGEVVSYVGDAVIVTWPLGDDPHRNSRCLVALRIMLLLMRQQNQLFEREFGVVPRFRAALHGGSVVIGECGDSRRQVTFLGDVVNMTSRIELAAKEMGIQFLASDSIVQQLVPPKGTSFTCVGEHKLRGADKTFVLHRIDIAGQPREAAPG